MANIKSSRIKTIQLDGRYWPLSSLFSVKLYTKNVTDIYFCHNFIFITFKTSWSSTSMSLPSPLTSPFKIPKSHFSSLTKVLQTPFPMTSIATWTINTFLCLTLLKWPLQIPTSSLKWKIPKNQRRSTSLSWPHPFQPQKWFFWVQYTSTLENCCFIKFKTELDKP